MRPLYWILIIVGVVGASAVTTLIIIKKAKDGKKSVKVGENVKRVAINT